MMLRTVSFLLLLVSNFILAGGQVSWCAAAEPEDGVTEPVAQPSKTKPELSPELLGLRDRVRECLAYYYRRYENAAYRTPWEIMHTLIAFGVDTDVESRGRKVNAIGWLCWNRLCGGYRLFGAEDGKLEPRVGYGVQGHDGQFLSLLALSRVPADYTMKANGHEFTVADLVEYEKQTCMPETELSFKLLALVHYLDSDASWKNQHGQDWDIPRLIREELAQPVIGGTCGGTHRMMGFSYAVREREKRGEPFEGEWRRAKKYVDDYHEYTFKLQNPDGSFSTNWFRRRGNRGGIEHRLNTTGHTLEWLALSLPDEELRDPRVVKSVDYLTRLLDNNRSYDWGFGARGHALHALAIYDMRVFGSKPGRRPFLRPDQQPETDEVAAQ
ncbi:MAG: hypothetical protein ISR77_15110 [Pirellulaceae bacterium]|nr:hypothetical protein [Pirellulaceae bacterium]